MLIFKNFKDLHPLTKDTDNDLLMLIKKIRICNE